MNTLTTATGKTYETDYAIAPNQAEFGFIRILNSDFSTICRTFANPNELPFKEFPDFKTLWAISKDVDAVQLTLKH